MDQPCEDFPTRAQAAYLLLEMALSAIQAAEVDQVALLGAGRISPSQCVQNLLLAKVEAIELLVGRDQAERLHSALWAQLQADSD